MCVCLPADAVYADTKRFTSALETKLAGIEASATADQTGAEMVAALEGLSGNARLQASAIRNLPGPGGTPETAASIRDKLETLTAGDRLEASAIQNLPVPRTDAQMDARIGPAFRAGALQGATREQMQDIVDSFDAGGWGDVTGPASAVPWVRAATRSTQYTASQIAAGTYQLEPQRGAAGTNQYVAVRVPVGYDLALGRLRLRIGADAYLPASPSEFYFPLDGQNVTHVTTSANYRYYSVLAPSIGAGEYLHVQFSTPWRLDEQRVELPSGMITGSLEAATGAARLDAGALKNLPHNASQTFDTSFPGLQITRTDTNQRITQPLALAPALTLTGSNQRGVFHASLHATMTAATDVNASFERNTPNATAEDRSILLSNTAFAGDLREEDAFDNAEQSNYNGLALFRVPAYSANTTLGHFVVLLARSATNAVSVFRHWEGAAGAGSATIAAELRLTFAQTDAFELGFRIVSLTQAAYDALAAKDATTIYLITG